MSSISTKANIVKFRSLDEITHYIPHRSFWDIVKSRNADEIYQLLSTRERTIAKDLNFLDENCVVVAECPLFSDDYCSDQFYKKLAKCLFDNDKYISWNSFRYLHPDFFIIETDRSDIHYAFTMFLHFIGIVNDLDQHSFYNPQESTLFVEYTSIGSRVVKNMQSQFSDRIAPVVNNTISDAFNQTGIGNEQTIQLAPQYYDKILR